MARSIQHPTHNCMLHASYLQFPYPCDGCHENGIGFTYRCRTCNFNLHYCCASNTNTSPLLTHPFHNQYGHALQFLLAPNPWGTNFCPPCNACGRPVRGFAYRCVWAYCSYVLHPCCAHLPPTMKLPSVDCFNDPEMVIDLFLFENSAGACARCCVSARGWAYVAPHINYSIHVGCAREMLLEIEVSRQAVLGPGPQTLVVQRGPTSSTATQRLPLQGVQTRGGFRLSRRAWLALSRTVVGILFGDPFSVFAAFTDLF